MGSRTGRDPIYGSQRDALARVERAIRVTASPESLAASGGLVIQAEGRKNAGAEYQGYHPDSLSPGRFREMLAFAADGERIGHGYRHDRYDGTYESIREVYSPSDRRIIYVLEAGFAVHLISPDHDRARRRLARRHPGLLLAEVRDRAAGLRTRGRIDGLEFVTATLYGGRAVDLGFDPRAGVLREVHYLQDAPALGDAQIIWQFDDYREVPGIGPLPHAYGVIVQGRPFTSMTVSRVATGSAAVAERLEPPPGIELPDPQEITTGADASAAAEVREVAPGVYLVLRLRGGFHPMFIEFEEFVLAVDAPAGYPIWDELPASDVAPGPTASWLSERFLELIRETVPDKPVRYVVITHFHNDHAGGLRAFVAEGATVLASPSAAAAIRELADAPHTIAPDRLSREGHELRLEIVDGRRTVGDDHRSVEVIDVGANPHTAHMLVVRIPELNVWFVSDLLDAARVERYPKPEHAVLDRWFAGWLNREGHTPERIYTMHGSGLVTPGHLARLGADGPGPDAGALDESGTGD